jgi:valyl-tRNA synthetase
VFGDGSEVVVALAGAIDVQQECKRLTAESERLGRLISNLTARLSSENFVSRAPADVVAREREKEKTWREQRDVLASKLRALGCV